ncbi:MAG: hypothetical protein GJU76_04665 [Gallionella sp.]|jgi:hypothetical protein|nr:hypothetical protein [Gallionella sp.]
MGGTSVLGGYTDLRDALGTLCIAGQQDGEGVALIVDVLQSLKSTLLSELVYPVFELRGDLPLALKGGGLTYLPAKTSRAITSTKRLRYELTDFLWSAPPSAPK